MPRVLPAQPYAPGALSSFGKGEYMLIAQHNFPDAFEETDHIHSADHDRVFSWDYANAQAALKKHVRTGEMAIGNWARRASSRALLQFAVEFLKADQKITWSGVRVLGTVNRSNGFVVWSIEVFALGEGSTTKVYSGENAPNVAKPEREWFSRLDR